MRIDLGAARIVPRWVVAFFLGGALVLIPWIVLMFTVPSVANVPKHWELVWGGFDCFLVLGFGVTAFRLITRSPRGAVTAAMTGTMLLIDAWFDVLTTHRGGQIVSILMAAFAEIPCAMICFAVSRRIVRLFEQAKDYLAEAGFQVHAGRLVPPAGFPGEYREHSHSDVAVAAARPVAQGVHGKRSEHSESGELSAPVTAPAAVSAVVTAMPTRPVAPAASFAPPAGLPHASGPGSARRDAVAIPGPEMTSRLAS
jgi:hypothetical protein